MKFIMRLLLVVLLILVVLVAAKDIIIKTAAEQGVKFVTGLELNMRRLHVSLTDSNISIRNLVIYNPKDFEEPIMLDMPEIFIDYHLRNILGGIIHLESVIINLEAFNVVRSSKGELNLDSLKVVQEGQEAKKEEAPKEKGKAPKLQLDNLELKLGRISFKDYSKNKDKPNINDFSFNLDEKYENITNPQVIIAIILQKAMLKASIAKLSGFDLGGLQGALTGAVGDIGGLAGDTLASGQELAGKGLSEIQKMSETSLGQAQKLGEGTLNTTKEGADAAVEKLKEQAENLKGLADKIKLPFGKEE